MNRPIRALHAYSGNLFGGVETFLLAVARNRQLVPGLDHAFALSFDGLLAERLRSLGLEPTRLGPVRLSRPWSVFSARRKLARAIEADRPDVLVCQGCWAHAVFAPVARKAGLPLVLWFHDVPRPTARLERFAARTRPDLAIANSRYIAATVPALLREVPVEVVYCPVDPPPHVVDRASLRSRVRAGCETPDDATVIVQVSRMEPWKGQSVLVEALGRLRAQPGWVAWFAGGAQRPHEAEYLAELKSRAVGLGIVDRIRFLGQRSDVSDLLAASDLMCQPNVGPEPFGIALIEALDAGLPVVTARLGGAVEIVDDSCGRLVPPSDPAALASTLTSLLTAPTLRDSLGSAGPSRARSLCDPTRTLTQLRDALASAIATHSAAKR